MTSVQGAVQETATVKATRVVPLSLVTDSLVTDSLVTDTLYPQHSNVPVREVRSPTAVYDVLTLSIEQLEYLEAISGAIVEALEQSVASDSPAERARVLARLGRSHSAHWLALLREEAEQRHPRASGGQASDDD